ncbi:MAG: hypothetical protein ACRC33_16670 [Gemmataceae bacterium]
MMDYDSRWEELVGQYFGDFLAFFFPDIAAEADPAADADQLEQEVTVQGRGGNEPKGGGR